MIDPLSNPAIDSPSPSNPQIVHGMMNRLILPLAAIILVLWNSLFFMIAWVVMPANDFGRMYHSAVAYVEGRDMYGWTRATPARLEEDYTIDLYNMNPPHLHLVLLPLTALKADHALMVWYVLNGWFFFCCLRWIFVETKIELTPEQRRWGIFLGLGFAGTAAMLATAQLSFLLLVPITLMWRAARHGRWLQAGAWLGLALAVKPFLGIVLVYFAFRGKWRAAGISLAMVALSFAAGLLVFGWDNHLSWQLRLADSEGWAWLPMNASLMGMLTRTFTESVWYIPLVKWSPAVVWTIWVVVGGIMGLVTLLATGKAENPQEVDRGLVLTMAGAVLLSPLGWIYYYWFLVPPLLAMWSRGWPGLSNLPPGWDKKSREALLIIGGLGCIWPIIGTRLFQPDSYFIRHGLAGGTAWEILATFILGNIYFWGLLAFWSLLVWQAVSEKRQAIPVLSPLAPEEYRVSVVMPVYSETRTVREITNWLVGHLEGRLEEIIIIQSPRSSAESRSICQGLAEEFSQVRLFLQENNPGLGNAVREGLARVRGNLVLCIDSDGEMEIDTVTRMLAEMERGNFALVAASRWLPGGGFSRYSPIKYVLNWGFQQLFRWLFWSKLHDLTYGFKLMRAELARGISWHGTMHEIACETTLKPVQLGLPVSEVRSRWTARTEGTSKNTFWRNFRYVWTAWDIFTRGVVFTPRKEIAQGQNQCRCGEAILSAGQEPAQTMEMMSFST